MLTIPYEVRKQIVNLVTNIGGPLAPAGLSFFPYNAPLPVTTRPVRAAVLNAHAAFAGATSITPAVWGADYRDGADNVFRNAQLCQWTCTADPAGPETIFGVAWDDGVNVYLDPFDTPVVIQKAGDVVQYIPIFPYGQ